MSKVGRPRTKQPKFCGNCGVKVGDESVSLRCPQCAKNSYLPTRRQIAAECRKIRAEKLQQELDSQSHVPVDPSNYRMPKVYSLPRSFR